jgi:hypothetical protein
MSEKELRAFMEDLRDAIKKDVTATVRWYLTFSFSVILILAGVMGYTVKQTIANGNTIKDLQTEISTKDTGLREDFGTTLLIMSVSDSANLPIQNKLANKYNPSRGLRK